MARSQKTVNQHQILDGLERFAETIPQNVNIYRPQRSCGKVIFLHLFVSHSVHRGVVSGKEGVYPSMQWGVSASESGVYIPLGIHSYTSVGRHAPHPGQTPRLGQAPCWKNTHTHTRGRHPCSCNDHWSRRYASYWNAFLLQSRLDGVEKPIKTIHTGAWMFFNTI